HTSSPPSSPPPSLSFLPAPPAPHPSTPSLHDALPIFHLLRTTCDTVLVGTGTARIDQPTLTARRPDGALHPRQPLRAVMGTSARSEEHTSELQSRFDLVCRLLLEKKKEKRDEP